jgi:hypothetical protein
MNKGEGIITKIYSWVWHPSNSSETVTEWAAGLIIILILSFLWSTVIKVVD